MTNKKQLLLAFSIPLFLAIGLLLFESFFFESVCTSFKDREEKVCLEYHNESFAETGYALLVLGLFILSFILPSFVMMRTYQGRLNKLESPSIIE
jgi:hypothetical protein